MSSSEQTRRRLRMWRRRRQTRADAMTIMEHLRELRTRIVISAIAFVAVSIVIFFLYDPIQAFLRRPLCDLPANLQGPQECDLVIRGPLGAFNFRLKLTAIVALAITSPLWLYQIYAFVAPALKPTEKRYSVPFVLCSLVLFLVGATFAYLTLPTGLRFLIGLGGEGLTPLLEAETYLNFVGLMLLAFGVTFELPLLLIFLGLVGAVSVEQLKSHRKHAVVAIFAISAVVTPSQDPYTMAIMAVPLYLMYEVTIVILSRVMRRRNARAGRAIS